MYFLGQTQEYKDYRFVLTENAQQMSIIVSDFEIMKIFHLTHGYTI